MPKVHLTAAFVRKAACPIEAQKIDFFDTNLPGFLLEVRKSGGKTYYQRCNAHGAKRHQLRIGPANILSLTQAKRRAKNVAARSLIGAANAEPKQWLVQPTYATFIRDLYL